MERADRKPTITSKRYNWYNPTYEDFETEEEDDDLKISKKLNQKADKNSEDDPKR